MAHKEYRVHKELRVLLAVVVAQAHKEYRVHRELRVRKVRREPYLLDFMGKVIQLKILLLQQRILHILPHQVHGQ